MSATRVPPWWQSAVRIYAMVCRYTYLQRRSLPRNLNIIFWPVMELLVWGYVTRYLQRAAEPLAGVIIFLIGAMIFWDLLYRSQQAVSLGIMEDVWTRNLINTLITPLRLWEWMASTFLYGLIKGIVVTVLLAVLAYCLYDFELLRYGWWLGWFALELFWFGWAVGVMTAGLLLRYGYAAEALIWGIPFLIQPFSAVFYPVEVLPAWGRALAAIFPSTYVFEGMRRILTQHALDLRLLFMSTLLNLVYALLGVLTFRALYASSRASGRLARIGTE